MAAGYLSKYVTKSFEDDECARVPGLHRYEVAEGFQPRSMRLPGRSAGEVIAQAAAVDGRGAGAVLVLGPGRGLAGSAGGVGGVGLSHLTV